MTDSLTLALRRATISTFENLAMLIAEDATGMQPAREPRPVTGIVLSGGTHGWFELEVTRELLPQVALGMLGTVQVDRKIETDVLGEIANVICGNMLAELGGDGSTHLSPPTMERRRITRAPAARAAFYVEQCAVEARLYLEPSVQ